MIKLGASDLPFYYRDVNERTLVIRSCITLKEPVDPALLERALNETLKRYPKFATRPGKDADLVPCLIENDMPASVSTDFEKVFHLGTEETNGHLFQLCCRKNEIRLSAFHGLSDGRGNSEFLKTILYYYYSFQGENFSSDFIRTNENQADTDRENEFGYETYGESCLPPNPPPQQTQTFSLSEDFWDEHGDFRIKKAKISMPTSELLSKTHDYQVRPLAFFSTLLNLALYDTYKQTDKPMIGSAAIDMRPFFASKTLHNFSNWMLEFFPPQMIDTDFRQQLAFIQGSFDRQQSIDYLKHQMAERLHDVDKLISMTPEQATEYRNNAINMLAAVKSFMTFFISNIGVIQLPDELASHIEDYSFYVPSYNMPIYIGVCSCAGNTTLTITQGFEHTEWLTSFMDRLKQEELPFTYTPWVLEETDKYYIC